MSDKALRVPLGLSTWQELNRRTSTFSRAYGDHTETEPDPHPQYVLKSVAQTAFSFAAYGGLLTTAPHVTPALGAGWATLEFDAAHPEKLFTADPVANTIAFDQDGVWVVSLSFSLSHNSDGGANLRTFQVRLFDVVDGVVFGLPQTVTVGRNAEQTAFAQLNLATVVDAQEGHAIRVEIGNVAGNAITVEQWDSANFVAWAVSEWPDPL